MLVSLFTGLTAASLALAGPVVHQPRGFKSGEMGGTDESGGHKGAGSAGDWLQVTSVEYSGNGCPEGTLTGQFCPESTSFNVTISDLKAELEDNKPDDVAYCYVKIGLRTSASKQVNVLRGEFSGHVKLESEGMTAYEKNTYSFSKNKGEHEMRWDFKGPTDLDTVFTNDIKTTFLSPCGGDFELILDNILELRRGDKAKQDDNGYIEISKLTGNLGHALVLEEKDCEKSDDEDSGKDDSGSDDYGKSSSYGKGGDGKGGDDGKDDDDGDDDKDSESEQSYSSNGNEGNNGHYRE